MRIHDLVIQGVRRFRENQRLAFQPGFNVIFGSNESGKSTLLMGLIELLYPDRFRDKVQDMVSWGDTPNSRAGLTVGQGDLVFRILRDFKSNRISLSRLNRATNKYDPVSEQAVEIASLLAENFHLPPFETFRNFFVDEVSRLPSALPLEAPEIQAPVAPAPAPAGPMGFGTGFGAAPSFLGQDFSAPGYVPPGVSFPGGAMPPSLTGMGMPGLAGAPAEDDDGLTLEGKEKRLTELREQATRIQEVEDLQFEMDGVQAKVFEIEAKKQNVAKLDEAMAKADEALGRYPLFRGLPDNIDERVSRFNDLLAIQARELEKIDQASMNFDRDHWELSKVEPFHKQQMFYLGVGLVVGGIAGMIFVTLLGILVAAGIAVLAYGLWHYFGIQHRREELEKKLRGYEEQKKQIIKKFEVEGAVIQNLLDHGQCDTSEELKNKIAKYREISGKRDKLEERKKEMMLELDWKNMLAEEEELKKKLAEMEARLRGQSVAGLEKTEIRRESERLEAAIKRLKPNAPAVSISVPSFGVPDFGGPAPSAPPSPSTTAPGITSPSSAPASADPGSTRMDNAVPLKLIAKPTAYQAVERLLLAAASVLGVEREALLQKIQSRLNLYLQAFSGKLYLAGRFEPGKGLLIQQASSQRWADFGEISPPSRDLAYFSLQITLLELLIPKLPLPFLLDDAFRSQDDGRRAVLGKALKRLAERSQVLLFTSQRNLVPLADHALNLG
jgi:energy-coupling factor transporter ATP-binding protein EcfA2